MHLPFSAPRSLSTFFALLLPVLGWWALQRPSAGASPERELRGAWMATVLNIDYPSRPTTDAAVLQIELRNRLRRLRRLGFNAVYLQVRPAADALYQSDIAPWSQWLTGQQGVAPASSFDPLAFAIEEAHRIGMELHAWLNPYRAGMSYDSTGFADSHPFHQHRDWLRLYGGRMYMDPGLPQVQDYLLSIVQELVEGYDLDGIHFDDYFYPYPSGGEDFPDSLTFLQYGSRFRDRGDWRRDNVNQMVARIYRAIKAEKPHIQFGISPFGIWRNSDVDTRGSTTQASATSYDDLYGDALHWSQAGTVDYLAPQLYFSIGYEVAEYAHLLDWWTRHTRPQTRIFIGQAAYKVGNNHDHRWDDLEQLPRQVDLNRHNGRIDGSIYFSTSSILQSRIELDQRLGDLYASPALLPRAISPSYPPLPPAPELKRVKRHDRGPMLVWQHDKDMPVEQLPYYYAIYRRTKGSDWTLIDTTPFGQGCHRYHYFDESVDRPDGYEYRIRSLDRYHQMSAEPAK